MNNNYHTQLNKNDQINKNNILSEVAYENNLMQNFQGTPINKNPQYNPQMMYSQPNIPNSSNSSKIVDEEIELSESKNDSGAIIEQPIQQRHINQQLQDATQNIGSHQKPFVESNSEHYNQYNSQKYDKQENPEDLQRNFNNFRGMPPGPLVQWDQWDHLMCQSWIHNTMHQF